MKKLITLALAALAVVSGASAQTITSYDVHHYSQQIPTGWISNYTGVVTFQGDGFLYLDGGRGTLNDGWIPDNTRGNMLFLDPALIILHLDKPTTLSELNIWGGNFSYNGIPGAISAANIYFGGRSVTMSSTGFGAACQIGPCNDRFSFAGTELEGLTGDLLMIQTVVTDYPHGYAFNIAEITVSSGVAAVPEPQVYAMLFAGLGLIGYQARRNKAQA